MLLKEIGERNKCIFFEKYLFENYEVNKNGFKNNNFLLISLFIIFIFRKIFFLLCLYEY